MTSAKQGQTIFSASRSANETVKVANDVSRRFGAAPPRVPSVETMTASPDSAPWPSGERTYHLARSSEWEQQRSSDGYRPSAFEAEGFVHCTDGLEQLLVPANAYFASDPGPFVVLEIDLDLVAAPVRYDAEPPIYPHIYGPIEPASVVATHAPVRDAAGRFTGFRPADPGGEVPPGQRA
jgi:uncharacterized protein (DUF952 family)